VGERLLKGQNWYEGLRDLLALELDLSFEVLVAFFGRVVGVGPSENEFTVRPEPRVWWQVYRFLFIFHISKIANRKSSPRSLDQKRCFSLRILIFIFFFINQNMNRNLYPLFTLNPFIFILNYQ
jgi:hypothetical protein